MVFYGNKIEVNVVTDLGESKYGVIIEDNRNMYKYLSKIIDSTVHRLPSPRKVRVNDFCLAMFGDDIWHRARVVNTNPLTVYFLDFANEDQCDIENIKIIPKDLEDDESFEDIEEELNYLMRVPPLAFTIQTEKYVSLEEGSLAKVVLQKEIEHNHWMVTVVRERDRNPANSSKRLEIVADPQHIEKIFKNKKTKAVQVPKPAPPTPSSRGSSVSFNKPLNKTITRSEHDSDVEFVSEFKNETAKRPNPRQIDRSSLVYSAVCHQPEFDMIPPPSSTARHVKPTTVKSRVSNIPPSVPLISKHSKPIVISDESEPEWSTTPTASRTTQRNNNRNIADVTNGLESLSVANDVNGVEPQSTYDSFTSWVRDYFVDYLMPKDKFAFIVHESCSNNEYCGMMICKRLERRIDALDELDSLTPQTQYRAKQGSFVATFLNPFHQWYRGYVVQEPTNIDPTYLLILFDIGIMYRTVQVSPLPKRFLSVPLLAVRCTVPSFPSSYDEMHRLEVLPMTKTLTEVDLFLQDKCIYTGSVKGKDKNGIDCDMRPKQRGTKHPIEVKFTPWVPSREEIGVQCIQLKSNDRVKITAIAVTNECYVVPVNEGFDEERNEFLDSVALHCRAAPTIDHEPKMREIVGIPCMKSFWRGQVVQKKKYSYLVHVLDLGININVSKDDMKALPDTLKFTNCYCACVLLDKLQRTDFNKGSEEFIKYVITHEKEFSLEIDKSSRLVNLRFAEEIESRKWTIKKGSSFNQILENMLKPLWKLSDNYDFGSLYFLSNFKFEEWEVGSVLSLLFVEKLDPKNATFINPKGDVYAKLVEVNLTERLTQYAEEKPDPYVPVSNELCVAKYDDGLWYRAVCICAEPGKDLQLQFIDIGYQRTVSHKNIRLMAPDFLKHPAASLFCEVLNCEDGKDLNQLKGKMLRQCKVVERIEMGGYALEVDDLNSYFIQDEE